MISSPPPPSFPTLSYDLIDVFTLDPCKPFTGNPLAVVHGTEGLTQNQLQRIAIGELDLSLSSLNPPFQELTFGVLCIEFNLSETTFPSLPSEEEKASGIDYKTRIFTIEEVRSRLTLESSFFPFFLSSLLPFVLQLAS